MRHSLLMLSLTVWFVSTCTCLYGDEPSATQGPNDLRALFQMHYANRVRAFQEQNQLLQNVVLVGDSITEGFDVDRYLPGRRVLNRGIGGDVIGNALPEDDQRGLLRRLDESIFNCAATDAFILIGVNDLGDGRTPDVMEPGYREMLEEIKNKDPTLRIHIQSVLPTRGNFAKHNKNVIDFNNRLQKLAEEFDYNYIDLHKLMADDNGQLNEEFTHDGLHLSDKAYKIWAAEVIRTLGW